MRVITGTPEQIAASTARYAEYTEWLPVEFVREAVAEAADFVPKITRHDKGTMEASWDPAIERSRSFTAKPGDAIPTAAMARQTLRKLRPGEAALLSNATRVPAGRTESYAELNWTGKHGAKGGVSGTEALGAHLMSKEQEIGKRASKNFEEGFEG